MAPTLCESFRALAFATHNQLSRARAVGHQPLEETFTDVNILELKVTHPGEIYSHTFTKRQEGTNGADWEWWLTNKSRTSWLGLRVQAKVLELRSDTFPHLHYASGNPKTYQLHRLQSESAKTGMVPLYCFYTLLTTGRVAHKHSCHSYPFAPEFWGCSIAPAQHVAKLQAKNRTNDLCSVISGAAPWHCLVCCQGYGGNDLPQRAWAYLQREFGISEVGADAPHEGGAVGPRARPPQYVYSVMEGQQPEEAPSHVRGILIVAPRDDG